MPPIIAIVLALLTKEVYSSLFIGILSGMLIYAYAGNGTLISAVAMTFDMMCSKIADNAYMIIFLALLWAVAVASEVSEKDGFYIFLSTIPYNFYALMSFSMGSSWGTFGILIPIVTMICETDGAVTLLIPVLGATLAGSIYGDHCSPISDTTILASTGANCKHIKHVETQLPYATLVAIVCAIGYLIVGFTSTPVIAILLEIIVLIGAIMLLGHKYPSCNHD